MLGKIQLRESQVRTADERRNEHGERCAREEEQDEKRIVLFTDAVFFLRDKHSRSNRDQGEKQVKAEHAAHRQPSSK